MNRPSLHALVLATIRENQRLFTKIARTKTAYQYRKILLEGIQSRDPARAVERKICRPLSSVVSTFQYLLRYRYSNAQDSVAFGSK